MGKKRLGTLASTCVRGSAERHQFWSLRPLFLFETLSCPLDLDAYIELFGWTGARVAPIGRWLISVLADLSPVSFNRSFPGADLRRDASARARQAFSFRARDVICPLFLLREFSPRRVLESQRMERNFVCF